MSESTPATQAYTELFYQHDSPSGAYDDLTFGAGWIGPSRAYRKIDRLDRDAGIRAWIAGRQPSVPQEGPCSSARA